MTTITKSVRFDAAHILTGYDGECKNLHGHTYRVDVSVSGGDADMVIDFKVLKKAIDEHVRARFDHAFIYDAGSAGERDIASAVERNGMKTMALPFRSTVENLAKYIFELLKPEIMGITAVKVWETADNRAEYCV